MDPNGTTFFFQWEVTLMEWLQTHCGPVGEFLANVCSFLGEQTIMVVILGFLYWCWDKEYGKYLGVNIFATSIWNPFLKNLVHRRRPYFEHPGITCLRIVNKEADLFDVVGQGYSFPSGHSSSAATVYGSVAAYQPKKSKARKILMALAIVLSALVGISRFVVGVHYPTDVLCGWALGIAVIVFLPWLRKELKNDTVFYILLLLSGLPGFFFCESSDFYTGYGLLLGFCLGIPFEERFVKFENTRVWWKMILRIAGGGIIYYGLNTLLKLPFSSAFLDSGTFLAHLVRTLRYALILFVISGPYPMLFKKETAK